MSLISFAKSSLDISTSKYSNTKSVMILSASDIVFGSFVLGSSHVYLGDIPIYIPLSSPPCIKVRPYSPNRSRKEHRKFQTSSYSMFSSSQYSFLTFKSSQRIPYSTIGQSSIIAITSFTSLIKHIFEFAYSFYKLIFGYINIKMIKYKVRYVFFSF